MRTLTFQWLMLPRATFYCRIVLVNFNLSVPDVVVSNILLPDICDLQCLMFPRLSLYTWCCRLTVTFQCLMDLRKFPLDEQICYIRMESCKWHYPSLISNLASVDVKQHGQVKSGQVTLPGQTFAFLFVVSMQSDSCRALTYFCFCWE